MFRIPAIALIQTTQELHQFMPVILSFGAAILGVLITAGIYYHSKKRKALVLELRRFRGLARHFILTRKEEFFLLQLLRGNGIRTFAHIFFDANLFERLVLSLEKKGRTGDLRLIVSVREKLFHRSMRPMQKDSRPIQSVESTQDLVPGIRLLLKYLDCEEQLLWGHLIEVNPNGLVVLIPSYQEIVVPLQPNTRLEVTAFLPDHDPVIFQSAVAYLLPGLRKLAVLKHAKYVSSPDPRRRTRPELSASMRENIAALGGAYSSRF